MHIAARRYLDCVLTKRPTTYRYNDSGWVQGTQRKSVNPYYKLSRQGTVQAVIVSVPKIFLKFIELPSDKTNIQLIQ